MKAAFRKIGNQAILAGGKTALGFFRKNLRIETKKDLTPVTKADRLAELRIRGILRKAFPGHSFFGEEFGKENEGGENRWIIDPIDGTKSYIRGIPLWATLLALERKGKIIWGAAYAPATGEFWTAEKGKGARKNGKKIRVSKVEKWEEAMICYESVKSFRQHGMLGKLLSLSQKVGRERGFGDYWGHMLVAEGRAELMVDLGLKPYDIAAPKIIVEEAGGKVSCLNGKDIFTATEFLTSNKKLHKQTLGFLKAPGK